MKWSTLATCASIAALLWASPIFAQSFKITDYRSLVSLSSVQVSADGKHVAFVRSTQNFKSDKNESTIVVIDTGSGTAKVLARGPESVSAPRWSPDGTLVGYLTQDSTKLDQVFVVPLKSGPPRQVTHAKQDVEQFSWSPKGDRLAYVTRDDEPNADAIQRHDDTFDMGDDGLLTDSIPVPAHIWIAGLAGGPPKRLTHGAWSVLETAAPFSGSPSDPVWSPDGKSIAFARQANPDDSDSDLSRIASVEVASGQVRDLTADRTYEYEPAYCPTSNAVAFLHPHGPTALSGMDVYATAPIDSDVSAPLDRNVTQFAWMPDGRRLIMMASDGIGEYLWFQVIGAMPERMDLGSLYPSEFNVGKSGVIAFVASNATTPPELYVLPRLGSKPRRLTDVNAALRVRSYASVKEVSWRAPDGERNDGVLTLPPGYTKDQKYPLVIFIHGGPEASGSAQFFGFEGDYLRQPLAADGFVFFQPNYRGSDNLGNAHEHAIYRDPCLGPASDILSGIETVEQTVSIDTGRIAIVGHSYGGLMTTWLISHDHRWRSAVVGDGAVDWRQTYDMSSDGNLAWARDSLGGTPQDPQSADLYRTGSPITYAGQIATPTLILSGTADETVPISESFELYHALKDRQVPVRFVAFPGSHHMPDDPVRHERFYSLIREWIRHYDPSPGE